MPSIGHLVKKDSGGFDGKVTTLSFSAPLQIVPVKEKAKENHPDFIVYSGRVEVGAAWNRIGRESGEPYISVSLAAVEFGQRTLYCTLTPDKTQDDPNVYALIWNPPD